MDFDEVRLYRPTSISTSVEFLPKTLTEFFVDSHRIPHYADENGLKRPSLKPDLGRLVGQDLNAGYEEFEEKPFTSLESLGPILTSTEKIAIKGVFDVVTWRGVLTKLMMTTEGSRDYDLIAQRHTVNGRSTVLLAESKSPQTISGLQARQCYWGRRFEVLTTEPGMAESTPACSIQEHCVVFEAQSDSISVLYAAEMDAWDGENWVELKVSKPRPHPLKSRRWWVQSYLAGIRDLLVGWRSDGGRIEQVRRHSIAEYAPDAVSYNRMLAFMTGFLAWLPTVIVDENLYEIAPIVGDGTNVGMLLRRTSRDHLQLM